MFLIRGFVFNYEAVRDWEAKRTPALAEELRRSRKGKVGRSWYTDETYIWVHGRWKYPYRAIDRDGALVDVMLSEHRNLAAATTLFGMYPFLLKRFADASYQGPQFANAVAKRLPHLAVEMVKRSDQAKGFAVLPMRWVVERTLAWLNRCRRLAKDFENLTDNALAFLRLASIRLMLRRLCNPS